MVRKLRHDRLNRLMWPIGWALAMWFNGMFSAWADMTMAPAQATDTQIERGAMSGVHGVVGVNVSAGDFNAQVNATAIAVSGSNGIGVANVKLQQQTQGNRGTAPVVSSANIEAHAFSNAQGVIRVNQASGIANAQANGVAIAIGIDADAVAEVELAQSVAAAGISQASVGSSSTRTISVDETAFNGASGIIQLNQSAGAANAMANGFTLRVLLPQSGAP